MPKNTNLPSETIQEIIALANDMTNVFAPPELIPGCEVLSISDKDQYDTNNGWIEAICGQHNNQRCRWKGKFAGVQVGDYVDVLYFKSAKLFDVLAKGGVGAITPGGGNVWPLAGEANIGATSYATISDGIDALASGAQLIIGEGGYTTDWTGGHAGIPTGADVKGSGVDVTVLADADSYVLEVEGESLVEQLTVSNTTTTGATALLQDTGGNGRYDTVKAKSTATSGTAIGFNIFDGDAVLISCEGEASGGGTNRALYGYDSGTGTTIEVRGGKFTGDVVADQAGCTIHLNGPTITGAVSEANGGSITGHYYNSAGDHIFLDTNDVYPHNDEVGLSARLAGGYAVIDHFETDALNAAWSWAAYSPFVTPGQIDLSIIDSILILSFDTTTASGPRGFMYRTDSITNGFFGFGLTFNNPLASQISGCRMDDGTDNNYVEVLFRKESGGNRLEIISRYRTGGGAVTTTVHQYLYDWPHGLANIRLQNIGTQWSNWTAAVGFSVGSQQAVSFYAFASGLTWTPVNRGFTVDRPGTTPLSFTGPYVDFFF